MITVTGFFQNPSNNLIYQSPTLTLVPHLTYPGQISMDVNIEGGGCIPYQAIDRAALVYDADYKDPYDVLLDALHDYVVADLKAANTINSQATFDVVVIVPTTTTTTTTTTEAPVEEVTTTTSTSTTTEVPVDQPVVDDNTTTTTTTTTTIIS